MELKISDSWKGNIFGDHAGQFSGNAVNVHVEAGGTNNIYQGGSANARVVPAQEAFDQVICAMAECGMLCEKNDFGIIFKLDVEMHVMGFKQFNAMADYLQRIEKLPESLKAQARGVAFYSFGTGCYPNWIFDERYEERVVSHIHSVARDYIIRMWRLGHVHPAFDALF